LLSLLSVSELIGQFDGVLSGFSESSGEFFVGLLDVLKVKLVEVGLESWKLVLELLELILNVGSTLLVGESTGPALHTFHAAYCLLEEFWLPFFFLLLVIGSTNQSCASFPSFGEKFSDVLEASFK